MRAQEIMGLTWERVDLKQGRILLELTKNGERRTVPLVGLALEVLKEHAKVRRLDTNLLWPGHVHADKPVDLRQPWLAALKEPGITDLRFHDLRHYAACGITGIRIPARNSKAKPKIAWQIRAQQCRTVSRRGSTG
jgi:integrase